MTTYITVKEMPVEERPRERLARVGPQSLSTTELLAIILRTGVGGENVLNMSTRILAQYGGLAGLARADFAQLEAVKGLGPAKTAQLLAAFELGRRLMLEAPEERLQIRSPADAAHLLMPLIGHKEQENFVVLYLDTRNRVTDRETLYKGSLNTSLVRVAEVFRAVSFEDLEALFPDEVARRGKDAAVGAGDGKARLGRHGSGGGHAHAADTDEVYALRLVKHR